MSQFKITKAKLVATILALFVSFSLPTFASEGLTPEKQEKEEVDMKKFEKKWNHQTVEDTFYIDQKAYKGEAFYYRICALNAENEELKSELSESALYCMQPATPVISTKNDNGNITISWKKVYGAQKYTVYRKTYNATTKTWRM